MPDYKREQALRVRRGDEEAHPAAVGAGGSGEPYAISDLSPPLALAVSAARIQVTGVHGCLAEEA
jgi:hypothetical protein